MEFVRVSPCISETYGVYMGILPKSECCAESIGVFIQIRMIFRIFLHTI